jgi:cation diffusion facilitator CzcD-associated flavoprotein CzcO
MLKFAKKYGVEKYIQLNTEVLSATWDEQASKWTVELKRSGDGTTFTDTCDVLVNGAGVVNKWKWPSIPGLHDFKGILAHSAAWDRRIDWKDKTVAVIGTGSSSIQMVPKLQETAKHVSVFIRNQTYIATPFGGVSNKDADPDAQDPQAAGKHSYTEKEKQRFRDDPEYHLNYRREVERSIASIFRMFLRGSEMNVMAKKFLQDDMARKLGDREDLKARFIPEWSPGCRRLTPGEGYLEALVKENVTCVFEDIEQITPQGIVTNDGKHHKVDILVCATGFYIAYLPHFRITGLNGQLMQDQAAPNVYASVAAPGFPNYFVVNGPRGNWGQGCVLPSHEVHIEYIMQCCRKMQEDRVRWMMPRQEVTSQLNAYMDAWHKKNSVWAEECKSWYKVCSFHLDPLSLPSHPLSFSPSQVHPPRPLTDTPPSGQQTRRPRVHLARQPVPPPEIHEAPALRALRVPVPRPGQHLCVPGQWADDHGGVVRA